MTALAAIRDTASKDGRIFELPMAVDIIYKGAMVCLNAAGFAAPASDAVDYSRVVGVAFETVDNSGGSAGDLNVRLDSGRSFKFVAASIDTGDVGRMMYVTDDQTFNDARGSFAIPAGVLVERDSSTVGWIHIPGPNDPVQSDQFQPQVRVVKLTNAQVVLFRGTPAPLIPAPGANKSIIVDRVTFISDDAAGAWTESTDNLVVQYADGVDITIAIEASSLVGGAVVIESYGVLDTVIVPDVNAQVELFNTGDGEWGGGNAANSMTVILSFHVIPTVAAE